MESLQIPKIIHLCWFSGEEFPYVIKHCIDSWRRVLPDYEIMLWDRERALSTKIRFVEEAISVRKWAFAADVIRLHALHTYGGVYMDADVFLMRRFDEFLTAETVYFIEHHRVKIGGGERKSEISIQAAFFAAAKGSRLAARTLEYYRDRAFILEDGSLYTKIIAPYIFAEESIALGFEYRDEEQHLAEDVRVYPSRFIAGNRREVTKESFGVHLCFHSWYDKSKMKLLRHKVKELITRYILGAKSIPL